MKAKLYDTFPGIILIFVGIALFLQSIKLLKLPSSLLIGIVLISLAPFYLFVSLNQKRKEGLALSVFLFFVGIVLFIPNEFLILDKNLLFLPTYLIIPTVIFIILIIDNTRLIGLWPVAIVLLASCLAAVLLAEKSTTIRFVNIIDRIITSYWPELVFFVGIGFILKD